MKMEKQSWLYSLKQEFFCKVTQKDLKWRFSLKLVRDMMITYSLTQKEFGFLVKLKIYLRDI